MVELEGLVVLVLVLEVSDIVDAVFSSLYCSKV
jgi:hypothetical protein